MTSATRSAVRWIADPIPRDQPNPPTTTPKDTLLRGRSTSRPNPPHDEPPTPATIHPPATDQHDERPPRERTSPTSTEQRTPSPTERHSARASDTPHTRRSRPWLLDRSRPWLVGLDPCRPSRPSRPSRRTHHPTRTTTHDPRPDPPTVRTTAPPRPRGGPRACLCLHTPVRLTKFF